MKYLYFSIALAAFAFSATGCLQEPDVHNTIETMPDMRFQHEKDIANRKEAIKKAPRIVNLNDKSKNGCSKHPLPNLKPIPPAPTDINPPVEEQGWWDWIKGFVFG